MNRKEQSLGLMFCGVCVLALLQMFVYNWVVWDTHLGSRFLITWWLVTGLGFLGFYGVGRILTIDIQRNLRVTILTIFGGAYAGCAAVIAYLVKTVPSWRVHFASLLTERSFFIVQISFMAFVAVFLAHFRAQGQPGFRYLRGKIRKRGTESESTNKNQPLRSLFFGVFFLGIIKDGFHWMVFYGLEKSDPTEDLLSLISLWLGIAVLFFGWVYWVSHKLKLDLHTNLPLVTLVILGGAYGASTMVQMLIQLVYFYFFSLDLGWIRWQIWVLSSPWFLQIFFMAFTAVSVVHLKAH